MSWTKDFSEEFSDCLFRFARYYDSDLQGEAMGRPSVVAMRITADGAVYVGGTATIVANGELMV